MQTIMITNVVGRIRTKQVHVDLSTFWQIYKMCSDNILYEGNINLKAKQK